MKGWIKDLVKGAPKNFYMILLTMQSGVTK